MFIRLVYRLSDNALAWVVKFRSFRQMAPTVEGEKHRSILDIADVKTVKVNHDLRELYDNGQLTIEEINAAKVLMEGRQDYPPQNKEND